MEFSDLKSFQPGFMPGLFDSRSPRAETQEIKSLSELARRETESIIDLRDMERRIFVVRGYKTFWFDVRERWRALACSSLNDWAQSHDIGVSSVHNSVNAVDVFFYFFDADWSVMVKVGHKKFSIILPIANQLRDALIAEYADAPIEVLREAYREAQAVALHWLQRASEESETALKDGKNGAESDWIKIGSREQRKADLLYIWDVDEHGNQFLRERLARELFDLFLEFEDVPDDKLVRVNVYGSKYTPEETSDQLGKPLELTKNGPIIACPGCGSGRLHFDEALHATCQQCGLRWNPETGEVFNVQAIDLRINLGEERS